MNKPNPHRVKTKTEQTPTGPVEYDAIECDECGYDVPLESAVIPVFPEEVSRSTYVHDGNRFTVSTNGDATIRVYCQDCAEVKFDEGVLDTPLHRDFINFAFGNEWKSLITIIIALYCFASGVLFAMLIIGKALGL